MLELNVRLVRLGGGGQVFIYAKVHSGREGFVPNPFLPLSRHTTAERIQGPYTETIDL
jgi:hypothetical protein